MPSKEQNLSVLSDQQDCLQIVRLVNIENKVNKKITFFFELTETEIGDFDTTILVCQQIRRLQIAMYNIIDAVQPIHCY